MNALPRTWNGVYNHGGRLLNKIPSKEGFDTPTVHDQNWTRAWLLQFYASQPGVCDPQTPEVWEQWANAQLPPRVKDFAQRVLWHYFTVHERVYKRSGTDKCLICSQKESIQHAVVECSMFKVAAAVIQHYFGQVATGDGEIPVRDMMESDHQEWFLGTDQGWAMWSARSTGDTDVKSRVSPVFTSYLMTWLRELCEWIGYYSGERRNQWRGFKQSLGQVRDIGVQPHQGVKCVVAHTYGVFHTRSERQPVQLARGSRTTPEAPEAGRPGSAARCTRPDCRIGSERVQNCRHRRVLKKIEPQRHAQGRWLRCIRHTR